MPMVPGLVPNIRLRESNDARIPSNDDDDAGVQILEDKPKIDTDGKGNVLRIDHPDGSITISIDGKSLFDEPESEAEKTKEWFRNLVDDIDESELTRISEELMRGVRDDIESRREWIDDRAQGIKLLGLKIEIPGLQGATDGAPVEGMSKVRHPLLLEAVLRFQAISF